MKRLLFIPAWILIATCVWIYLVYAGALLLTHFGPRYVLALCIHHPDAASEVVEGFFGAGSIIVMSLAGVLAINGKLPGTRKDSQGRGFPVHTRANR
jgi:hypothetical protein